MHAEWPPNLAPFVEGLARDARRGEVGTQLGRHLVHVERAAVLPEYRIAGFFVLAETITPRAQAAGDSGVERPGSRVVRLVLVQAHDPTTEVDIAPAQRGQLLAAHALAREDAEEEPPDERNGCASEKRAILVRVQERERFGSGHLREPAAGDGIVGSEATGIDGETEHAPHELRDVPARRLRQVGRHVSHDLLSVIEREFGDGHACHDRLQILRDHPLVVRGVFLLRDMIGPSLVQIASRPLTREIHEAFRSRLGQRGRRACAKRVGGGLNGRPRARGSRLRRHLQELHGLAAMTGPREPYGDLRHGLAALRRAWPFVEADAHQQEALALSLDADARLEAARERPQLACRLPSP